MLLLMSAIVASTMSDPVYTGPLCAAPPRDASDSCVSCYEDACIAYIKAWYECDGDAECRELVRLAYLVQLGGCGCSERVSPIIEVLNDVQARDYAEILGSWGE
ncbi:MAG: hypothetical protein LAT64_02505 [Phycisphaerales bacterium]|nr:hypothetical protein [Planctomycetota bacterium]MCH8507629.1 hypothetical protein [Phycisphaerales bacterium]